MKRKKLFCLPYAGGSASGYECWKKTLGDRFDIIPVELAGRGKRFGEKFYSDWSEAVADTFERISRNIRDDEEDGGEDYCIFGHSMGALLAYDIAEKMQHDHGLPPDTVYCSGCLPPHIEHDEKKLGELPADEFRSVMSERHAVPCEILDNSTLCSLFLPVIQADYSIVEQYPHNRRDDCALKSNIEVLYGDRDEMTEPELREWRTYTEKDFSIFKISGDHMFIRENEADVISVLAK